MVRAFVMPELATRFGQKSEPDGFAAAATRRIAARPDVADVRAQVTVFDDPEWPFSDTVWVITSAQPQEVAGWFAAAIRPDECSSGWGLFRGYSDGHPVRAQDRAGLERSAAGDGLRLGRGVLGPASPVPAPLSARPFQSGNVIPKSDSQMSKEMASRPPGLRMRGLVQSAALVGLMLDHRKTGQDIHLRIGKRQTLGINKAPIHIHPQSRAQSLPAWHPLRIRFDQRHLRTERRQKPRHRRNLASKINQAFARPPDVSESMSPQPRIFPDF